MIVRDVIKMAEQEDTVIDLQRHSESPTFDNRLTTLETNFAVFVQEMRDFKEEVKDFKQEMRQQNEMRAAEKKEIRDSIKEIYKTTDSKIAKIESNIQSMTHHIQILTITAMGGIIAAGIGIAAMVWSVVNR